MVQKPKKIPPPVVEKEKPIPAWKATTTPAEHAEKSEPEEDTVSDLSERHKAKIYNPYKLVGWLNKKEIIK